jgi:hypothetical protein
MLPDAGTSTSILDLLWHYVSIFLNWTPTLVALAIFLGFGIAEFVLGSLGRQVDLVERRSQYARYPVGTDFLDRHADVTTPMYMPPVDDEPLGPRAGRWS